MLIGNVFAGVSDRFKSVLSAAVPTAERQSGVIPYSTVGDAPAFLLITSRRTGRWIFPKGRLANDMTPWESAAREAYEEAGVEGIADTVPVGSYRTWKTRGIQRLAIEVEMYPFRVERQFDDWRETDKRRRCWASQTEVGKLIMERRLVELVDIVADRIRRCDESD